MSMDKTTGSKFDDLLRQSLQQHLEQVPADFTEQVLKQIEQAEQQRVLAQIIFMERVSLAGCILLGAAVITSAVVFPDVVKPAFQGVADVLLSGEQILGNKISQTIKTVGSQWQFYTLLTAVLGFAIYNLVDLLLGDRFRIA